MLGYTREPAGLHIVMGLVMIVLVIGLGWVLPITLGVRLANKKNHSALWMLFGIHPVGGWIAFIVLACVTPRVRCINCGGFFGIHFRICPYCQTTFGNEEPGPVNPSPPLPQIPGQIEP
ncbi:MAG: hypothetical protein QGG42_02715 [Phycisphaerae bacterium]|nr:hypothetical protein [Phycisphaerae bacterium]